MDDTTTAEPLYAWRTDRPPLPENAQAGCPASGWMHEGHPPWRVITTTDPQDNRLGNPPEWYAGDEGTVDVAALMPPPRAPAPVIAECTVCRQGAGNDCDHFIADAR